MWVTFHRFLWWLITILTQNLKINMGYAKESCQKCSLLPISTSAPRPGCILRCGAMECCRCHTSTNANEWNPPAALVKFSAHKNAPAKDYYKKAKPLCVCYIELSPHVQVRSTRSGWQCQNVIMNSKNVLVISYNPNFTCWRPEQRKAGATWKGEKKGMWRVPPKDRVHIPLERGGKYVRNTHSTRTSSWTGLMQPTQLMGCGYYEIWPILCCEV